MPNPSQLPNSSLSQDAMANYLFRYFEIHAGQRMSTFNFFIIFASLLSGGMFKLIQDEGACSAMSQNVLNPFVGCSVAAGLFFVSIIFWKLDCRVKFLISRRPGSRYNPPADER